MELYAQEKGQVENTSPVLPEPNSLRILKSPKHSIPLTGNAAPKILPAARGLQTTHLIRQWGLTLLPRRQRETLPAFLTLF